MSQVLKEGSRGLSTENWKVFHPNGKHMFTCGERKATWYLDKNLAKQIGEKQIKLTFEPKGYGFNENEIFGLAGRKIRCVVTGESEGLQRHHIVPYCYRTHFDKKYKSKNHHDVVLVTYKIHQDYERLATQYKNKLAYEYGVKTLNDYNLEYTKALSNFYGNKVKTLSKLYSIFKNYGKIPQEVIVDNLRFVAKETGIEYKLLSTFTYIQLWKLYCLISKQYNTELNEFKKNNINKYNHGYELVKKLNSYHDISDFVYKWRKHFIDSMKPKYMPEGWSVDFRIKVNL